jgi:predicted transposase/invertase (TIGR01784 family)
LEKVEELALRPVEGMSAVERWAAFLRYAGDARRRGLVSGLMKAEEGIAMAGEMLLTVSRSELDHARRDADLKAELDWKSYMYEARQEGLAEGEAKARREKLESARRLKDMGIPPDKITAGLGLSPEDVEAL